MVFLLLGLGLPLLLLLLIAFFYNKLVKARQFREEALSGIDVQLKRRADLVPQLVESVKGYAGHEKAVFEEVTALRSAAGTQDIHDIKARAATEQKMTQGLANIIAIAEDYADLKASANFIKLMDSLIDIEDHLQMARRYYNGTVRNLNILVQSFPGNLVAGLFGFAAQEFFELDSVADRLPPHVSFTASGKGEPA
ncbi:MAG: LemA family protein [Rhodospirillales bacterium]|nr:LemA family protein [Rhodospirillales bacterium]MCB9996790.1 LemA family protein [Rhodospirillales bacterium]